MIYNAAMTLQEFEMFIEHLNNLEDVYEYEIRIQKGIARVKRKQRKVFNNLHVKPTVEDDYMNLLF